MELLEFMDKLQEDIEMLGENTQRDNGVIRSMIPHLGVNDTNVIIETLVEGADNGDDLPYPVLRFHITLAKDIEPAKYRDVTYSLNELNTVIDSGEFPSFGGFRLYMPLGQIYMSYRMPINTGNLECELENARFFLGTVFEQMDLFVDMVLYIAEGNDIISIDSYIEYLKEIKDIDNIPERAERLDRLLNEQIE